MGIFEIKIYVNVCRFLSNYFCFSHLTASFSHLMASFSHIFLRTKKKCNIRHPSERGWGYCTPNVICQSIYLMSLFLYFTMTLLVFLLPSARVFTMMLIPFLRFESWVPSAAKMAVLMAAASVAEAMLWMLRCPELLLLLRSVLPSRWLHEHSMLLMHHLRGRLV